MKKILFVCHGNICRSTMAEYVMKYLVEKAGLSSEFYIDSAGTSREEIGNGVHYGTVNKLRSVGIPVGNHRARQITSDDFREFDYIIGMDYANKRNLLRMVPPGCNVPINLLLEFAGIDADIADPWYTGDFQATWDDVAEGCEALLTFILKNNTK